jgi:hypothetical protein
MGEIEESTFHWLEFRNSFINSKYKRNNTWLGNCQGFEDNKTSVDTVDQWIKAYCAWLKGQDMEEGRGQCNHYLLLKFTPGCVQRHCFQVQAYLLWLNIGRRFGQEGGVSCCVVLETMFCRTSQSVCDQIQSLINPQGKNLGGEGAWDR